VTSLAGPYTWVQALLLEAPKKLATAAELFMTLSTLSAWWLPESESWT
jgi:hypothetical protein